MHAEVLAIGDEVVSGRILDTNSQWLSRELEAVGVRVHYHSACGDDVGPLAETFRRAVEQFCERYPGEPAAAGEWHLPKPRDLGWNGLTAKQLHAVAMDDCDPHLP